MAKIIIHNSDGTTSKYGLNGETFTVGRAPDNDLMLPNGSASNRHAILKLTESGDFELTDLDSTNKTRINDHPIKSQILRNGDFIYFGDILAEYVGEPLPEALQLPRPDFASPEPHATSMPPALPPALPSATSTPSAALPSYYTPPLSDPELADAHDRASRWPMVLGIIGIVFGFFGLCGGVIGLVALNASKIYTPELMEKHSIILKVLPLVGIVLAVLLLVGGILLLMRKPSSRMLILTWATSKIGYAVWNGFATAQFTKDAFAFQIAKQPNSPAAGIGETMASVSSILGTVWLCLLPIFMLIWFLRRKISNEVASWGHD